jgi:hypothetical protein
VGRARYRAGRVSGRLRAGDPASRLNRGRLGPAPSHLRSLCGVMCEMFVFVWGCASVYTIIDMGHLGWAGEVVMPTGPGEAKEYTNYYIQYSSAVPGAMWGVTARHSV